MNVQPWAMYIPQTHPLTMAQGAIVPGLGGGQLGPQNLAGLFGQPQFGYPHGSPGGLLPFQVIPGVPQAAWGGLPGMAGQFALQGLLSPPFGQPQLGPQLGQPQLGLPYGQPQFGQPQLGPQFGQLQFGQPQLVPQFGQPQLVPQFGYPVGGFGSLLPYHAAPITTPGIWGGQQAHLPYTGWQLIPQGIPAGSLLPYHAVPALLPGITPFAGGGQWMPQNLIGNQVGGLAGPAGQTLGGYLPYQAAPLMAAVA
jgi:hypothetical protein